MSRQRIRSGVIEGSTVQCPHCMGAGVVRSTSSVALHVLRVIEDALIRNSTHDVILRTRTPVALYILNQKRAHLRDLEERFGVAVLIEADDSLTGATTHAVERGETAVAPRENHRPAPQAFSPESLIGDEPEAPIEAEETEAEGSEEENGSAAEGEAGRRRRRRRRRRGGERDGGNHARPEGERHEAAARIESAPIDGEEADIETIEGEEPAEGLAPESREGSGEPRRGRRRRPRRPRFGLRDFAPADGEGEGAAADAPAPHADESGHPSPSPSHEASPQPSIASEAAAAVSAPAPSAPAAALSAPEPATIAPAPVVSAHPSIQPVEDPNRPRRTGWWQKAKMTLIGD